MKNLEPFWTALVVVAFLSWVVNLIRVGRLYSGYAVLIVVAVVSGGLLLGVAPLGRATSALLERVLPTTGVLLLGGALGLAAFVYLLTQITILSDRLAALTQEQAILEARRSRGERAPAAGPESRAPGR